MKRLITFATLAAAAPLALAHPGYALDGILHRALHAIGTETVVAIVGALAIVAVAFIARRRTRRLAETARD